MPALMRLALLAYVYYSWMDLSCCNLFRAFIKKHVRNLHVRL